MATPHGNDESGRRLTENEDVDGRLGDEAVEEEHTPADRDGSSNVNEDAAVWPSHVVIYQDDDKDKMQRFFQSQINDDEGCVMDMTEASSFARYPLTDADGLPPVTTTRGGFPYNGRLEPDDSGFSSRVSEDSTSLHRAVEIADLNKAVAVVAQRDAHDDDDDSANDSKDKDVGAPCSVSTVVRGLLKFLCVILLLYVFICSLDLLSNAFRLLGGKTAGSVFQDNALLENPITGLMIGVLATVILQSSSTSSSIVITMVSSGILAVRPAIPIIMGANIGTTVTNTLVSLAHSMHPAEFRRAFSGATVHDVFNWLTVLILLPLEHVTGYLYHLTLVIVDSLNMEELRTKKQDLLKQLTKPLTKRIVQVDKKVISAIAEGKADPDARLLKVFCSFNETLLEVQVNKTHEDGNVSLVNETVTLKTPQGKCESLLSQLEWSDSTSGILLFCCSLVLLSGCLYLMVKLLHSMLGSHVARVAKKTINANFPSPFTCLTDYFVLLVGAGMTILVQSSSVFTSALTPLVGVGCLKLERMYPLTLGSNIGTTATGILAALASSNATMKFALQLALCHLFFNISGILLFFPVPIMRRLPLRVARFLGRTTATYRWFAVFYLFMMFLVFPGCFLALSFAGEIVFAVVLSLVGLVMLAVLVVNALQNSRFLSCLPPVLRSWTWLPLCLRSLQPLDSVIRLLCSPLKKVCCCCSCLDAETEGVDDSDTDSEDGDDVSIGGDVEDCSCCCLKPRGVVRVQQSEVEAAVVEVEGSAASASCHRGPSAWSRRTCGGKALHPSPSPSCVPLIPIPESVV